MKNKNGESVAILAGILVNSMRRAILESLMEGPCKVNDLADKLGIGQAVISKQLGLIRDAGLIACQPNGRCREYALADKQLFIEMYSALQKMAGSAAQQAEKCSRQQNNKEN